MMLRTTTRTTRIPSRRRGFSLAEVLLALAILGVGLISIAALFPAGIAQQRRSQDALYGPIVAANALDIIRSKMAPGDFGRYEDFLGDFSNPLFTIYGDFPWARPGHWFEETEVDDWTIPAGSADLFYEGDSGIRELPHNPALYGNFSSPNRPHIIITQRERYFPMVSSLDLEDDQQNLANPTEEDLKPQYVWDFALRRFNGRMKIAIFVYRISSPPTDEFSNGQWIVQQTLPQYVRLAPSAQWDATVDPNQQELPNTDGDWEPWHADDQWFLDQNGNVYRTARGRRTANDPAVILSEFVRTVPNAPAYFTNDPDLGSNVPFYDENVVTWIWHIPPIDDRGVRLTPVYIAVEDL